MSTLYRKYRPQTWADVAGQNHVKVALSFEVQASRIAHAYLFSGPRGIGKTTVARLLAKAVNCEKRDEKTAEPCNSCPACEAVAEGHALDVIEIDAASHRGIDSVRDNIVENARFFPSRLKYKVFIIDEVHMLTTEAFNALLKTLEEPPPRVIFILATTELHKLPATVVSRCQRFDFKRIPYAELVGRLHVLAEREGYKVEKKVIEEIARCSDGSLRDAEGLLGKVLTVADGKKVGWDEAAVVLPRSDSEAVAAFVESLLRRDGGAGLSLISRAVDDGCDLDQFAGDSIELLRRLLVLGVGGSAEPVTADLDETRKAKLEELARISSVPELVRAIETLIEKRRELKTARPQQLPLELAVARLSAGASPADAVASIAPSTPPVPPKPSVQLPVTRQVAESAEPPVPSIPSDNGDVAPVSSAELAAVCSITSDALRSLWPDFIAKVGEDHPSLQLVLGSCELVEVKDNVVRVGTGFPFHRDRLNSLKVKRVLETVLAGLVGTPLRLESVTLEKNRGFSYDEPAKPAAPSASPEVAALAEAFGGKVVN